MPTISVIMGIYNCEKTLGGAIESLLSQSYTDFELIICDDASTDGSFAIAEAYVERNPGRIKLLKNESNMKLSYCLNRCLEVACGEYIARMDGDDISLPQRFEKQINYLKSHPESDLVGSFLSLYNEKDGPFKTVKKPEKPDKFTLRRKNPFNHATIMCKKAVFDALGGYRVSRLTERSQDKELWFRFFKEGFHGNNIPQVLYYAREDGSSVKRRSPRVRWNRYIIIRNGFKLLGFPWYWRIKPFFETVLKICMPAKVQIVLKKLRKRND